MATDGDDDTLDVTLSIRIVDDTPIIEPHSRADYRIISDDDDVSGLNGNPGFGDNPVDGTPSDSQEYHQSGKSLPISFGADGGEVVWNDVTSAGILGIKGGPASISFEVVDSVTTSVLVIRQDQGDPANPVTVAEVTLNKATGAYSYVQVANLLHVDNGNNVEDDATFVLGYTVTDGDGDTVDGSIDLIIDDDTAVITEDRLIVSDDDELSGNPGQAGAEFWDGQTTPYGSVTEIGDGEGIGAGTPGGDDVETEKTGTLEFSAGADGGTVAWNTDDSGTVKGASDVEFRLNGDGALELWQSQNGVDVLIVEVTLDKNTGDYAVIHHAALAHEDNDLNDENNADFKLAFTVTDGDGDEADGAVTLRLDDDTPSIRPFNVNPDRIISKEGTFEDGISNDTGNQWNKSGKIDFSVGADGAADSGAVAWDADGSQASDGSAVGFSFATDSNGTLIISQEQNGSDVVVAEVTMNSATGAYTVTQKANVLHTETDSSAKLTLQFTVTDGDGDTVVGERLLWLRDDTPTATPSTTVWLDDEDVPGADGNPGGTGDKTDAPLNLTGFLNHSFGADSDGASISWLDTSSATVAGLGFTFEVTNGGATLLVKQNGELVITANVNQSTGFFDIVHEAPISHPTGNDENEVTFQFRYEVKDGDGDTAQSYLWVNVDDDSPTATPSTTVWLDDEDVPGADGNPGGTGDKTDAPLNLTGFLNHSFGADSDGAAISWLDTSSATVAGLGFTFEVTNGGATLLVKQSGELVITANVNQSTGFFDIVHEAPISHPTGNDENEVTFQFRYEVKDGDGDTAQSYLWVNVDDDSPTATPSTTVWLDDEGVPGADGNPGGTGDKTDAPLNLTGFLNHSFGADSDGAAISWLDTSSATVAGLGFTFEVTNGGATLLVKQSGELVITANVNQSTGFFDIVHEAPISHPTGNDENEVTFQFRYEVKDGDGDTAQSYLWVNVDDDTPIIGTANTMVQLDDENVGTDGNAGVGTDLEGTSPDETQDTDLTGTLAHAYGADGAGSVLLTGVDTLTSTPTAAEESFYYGVNAAGTLLTIYQIQSSVAVAVLSVTLDGETSGYYTVEQLAPIDHPDGSSENNVSFDVTYRVTDLDGDTVDGTLPINVDDDSPVANDDTTATAEDTAVLIDVFANDLAGADGVDLSTDVAVASGASNGSVSYNNNGTFTYTPNGGYAGADSFTYTITDADGDQSIATVNITVSAVDDGEATVTITGTAAEGSTLTANFGDDDPDGAASGVTYQWQRDGADIVGATGTTYDLVADDVGAKITVEVAYTDGQGFSENIESPQTDTVTALNAAPVLALNDIAAGATAFDDFSSGNYSGGSGWNGNWNEYDPGPQNDIRISSGRLRFDDSTDGGESISRAIDLSGMSTATLSFDYRGDDLDSGENVQIQAWNGSSWDTLGTLGGDSGGNFSIGLSSAQIGAHTQIRFLAQGNWENSENFYIDNVSVTNLAKVSSTDFVTSYTEGDAAVSVAAAGPTITDDNTMLQSATIHLTNAQAGDILNTSGVTGVTVDGSSTATSVVLTGNASLEVYQAAIQAITYANTNDDADTTTPRAVDVSVTDIGGLTSNTATAEITFLPVNDGNASIGITGTAKEGSTLTANFGDDDPDGAASGVTYQWQRGGADIDGATGSTYDLVSADVGARITVEVAYTDGQGFSENIESAQTDTVTPLNAAPTPVDDIVLKNFGNSAFNIPEWAFLLNDTDPEGDPLDVSGVSNVSSLDSVNHTAGSGPNGYVRIDGDSGFGLDGTFQYAASDGTTSTNATVRVVQDNNSITGTSDDEIFAGDNDGDTFAGGGGKDAFFAGGGNDTIRGDQDDHVFDGGSGNDTLEVGANFTSTSDAQIVRVETVELKSAATLDLSNQSEGFKILGSSGNDTIVGGAGNDIINGQEGTDSFTGNGGADQFRLVSDTGTKTIVDYTDGTDKIGFFDAGYTAFGSVNFSNTSGNSTGRTLNGSDFSIRSSFADIRYSDDYKVVRIDQSGLTTADIQGGSAYNNALNTYVIVFNDELGVGQIWFDTNWIGTLNRSLVATLSNITSLAQLQNITASDIVVYNSENDPIALDLNGDGVDLSATAAFDIDADGDLNQIGWAGPEDGLLVMDLDGSGKIEDGTEVFSEVFGGESFANSLEALASLDDNGDGVIDANDAAFGNIKVWQDANSDGVTQEGELLSLVERGIEAINLEADAVDRAENGNVVFAEGTYTRTDGGTGTYVGVSLGAANDDDADAEDTVRQSSGLAAGAALMVYAASTAEVAAGLTEVRVDGAPLHGDITIADDFTVTYTSMAGFEGSDAVGLELVFADGSIVNRTVELEVLAEEAPAGGSVPVNATEAPDTGDDSTGETTDSPAGDTPVATAEVTMSLITGDDGDNVLVGTDGDDILAGGLGADLLTGGAGADTFVLSSLAEADIITDYSFDEGDKLDIGSLLDGAFNGADESTLVRATERADGSVTIEVDIDGADAGHDWQAAATLLDHTSMGDTVRIVMDQDGTEVDIAVNVA
ncbi:DUF5801 repeats-in-toxin domain-containing protein [uncultured Roseibium sp.]|uniref:beta strand repeat-containing protein n=1 Tax=uncultured Roseibium sp. TaxID=1936171 RepID=UPI002604257A|nr:DUF5801 repeats-in-toxin domain-containing protein [uncultured Roseibium sp.]